VGEFNPIHWLIVMGIMLIYVAVPVFLHKIGKKVGDQAGYIRGYKEGQQSLKNIK
jgi:Sec-independent protein translocase protein TatA